MALRWFDRFLVLLFIFATFIALVYEPLFLLQCGWDGLKLGADGPCTQTWVGRAWLGYLLVEPLYADAPVWIQLVNEFDVFLFGWFYVLSVVVFWKHLSHRRWYRNLATFVSGMMIYSMVLYLTWQVLTYRDTGANLTAVVTFNGMWLVIFSFLLARLYLCREKVEG
jgi:hypothetical protein